MKILKRILKVLKWALISALGLIILAVIFVAILVNWPLQYHNAIHTQSNVIITDIAVVDMKNGVIVPHQTVIIKKNRIDRIILDSSNLEKSTNTIIINGSNKFLIPGLWDMHVHSFRMFPQINAPLYLANGVTKIRDMKGCYIENDPLRACAEDKRRWNQQILNGELTAPLFMGMSSFSLVRFSKPNDVYKGKPEFYAFNNEQDARKLANYFKEKELDFIKVHGWVTSREAYFALLDEAKKLNIPVVGHLPINVSAIEASEAGQRSIEHAFALLWDGYPGMKEFRKNIDSRKYDTELRRAMIDESDSDLCDSIFRTFVKNGTYFCPTHLTRKMDAFADNEEYRNDQRLKYIIPPIKDQWNQDADHMIWLDSSIQGRKTYMDFYMKGLELTGKAHQAGVKILAGTDARDTYCFYGFSLHDELQELVKAGLSPLDALRSATIVPAEFLGMEDEYGLIEKGYVADLVILDKNPLEKISNTTAINTVIHNGNVYDDKELNSLLSFAEEQANRFDIYVKFMWQAISRQWK